MSLDIRQEIDRFKKLVDSSIRRELRLHPVFKEHECFALTVTLNEELYAVVKSSIFIDSVVIGEERIESSRIKLNHQGKECTILFKNTIQGFKIFFREIDAIRDLFVGYDNFSRQELTPCYIVEHDWFWEETHRMPEGLQNAYQYIPWIELLKQLADYRGDRTCVYFKEKKLELNVSILSLITNGDVVSSEPEWLGKLKDHLQRSDHQDVRMSLFKGVLIEYLAKEKPDDRLRAFFENIKTIYESYQTSFDLYLEKFSYENLKTEAEKVVSDTLKRLYDAVAALRNQAIVIATSAIAVSQYSPGFPLRNSVIWMGTLLASIVYHVLIVNQQDVIRGIEKEKNQLERKLERIPGNISMEEFRSQFKDLSDQIKGQRKRLCIFWAILWISFGLSTVLYVRALCKVQ